MTTQKIEIAGVSLLAEQVMLVALMFSFAVIILNLLGRGKTYHCDDLCKPMQAVSADVTTFSVTCHCVTPEAS